MVRSETKKVLPSHRLPTLLSLTCSLLYSIKDLAIEPAVRSHPDNPPPLPLNSTM